MQLRFFYFTPSVNRFWLILFKNFLKNVPYFLWGFALVLVSLGAFKTKQNKRFSQPQSLVSLAQCFAVKSAAFPSPRTSLEPWEIRSLDKWLELSKLTHDTQVEIVPFKVLPWTPPFEIQSAGGTGNINQKVSLKWLIPLIGYLFCTCNIYLREYKDESRHALREFSLNDSVAW